VIPESIRRLPSNALHNLVALLLPVAASLAATPFIVHRLGDEQFGLYMLVLSVVALGGLIDLGVATASVKFVAESRARGDAAELSRLVNSLVTSRLPFALALVVAGYLTAPPICTRLLLVSSALLPEAVLLIRTTIATVAISLVGGTIAALPRAAHRYDLVSRASLAFGLAMTGVTVLLVWLGRGLREIAFAELALACSSLVVSGLQAKRTMPDWRFRPELDPGSLRRILVFGGYVSIGTLTGFLFAHANRILVGRTLGIAAVTYYSVPWNVSARVVQVVYSLAEVIAPLASALAAQKDVATLRSLYTRTARMMAVVAASAAVPLFVGAADLLWVWLGAAFADRSTVTLRILALAAVAQSLSAVPYMILNGAGRPVIAMLPTVAGASINIALAWLFGTRFGLSGFALAVWAGLVLQTALLMTALDRYLDVRPSTVRRLVWPAAASLVGVAGGWTATTLVSGHWSRLIIGSLAGLFTLHVLLLTIGWYEKREIDFMLQALFGRRTRPDAQGDSLLRPTHGQQTEVTSSTGSPGDVH
jgi:O-antigen/teichoic acid export membrane protein